MKQLIYDKAYYHLRAIRDMAHSETATKRDLQLYCDYVCNLYLPLEKEYELLEVEKCATV